ncbi:23S rRNA pseudouridine(955/2504/2580) synthase RluC [Buchnera aphidicola (Muscaphis stroyani)]|uniref:Pseudouridine synthase n=1 Tax=Buchnera aphidicola (Muscaphis stroyani) TaxID=1241869 RepID=A0A4D6YF04_9GAMM|nr:23S rRNA pseudouridine(955/2504/2580) synthase RluC [Buchnera aphidicola]QCI24414.1 23S rRNA pseudouridine(955/2504/2580) synthase RluC [Buchnera aphidicola (Muscaphis stroyani)]
MTNKILPASIFSINEDAINQRLDNFILKKFKKLPKSMIYRIIRIGKIRINMQKVKPYYKLKKGDELKIPSIYVSDNKKNNIFCKNDTNNLSKSILYEDKHLLIINKPSGIAAHGGSGLKYGVIEYFRKMRPLDKYLELVHRIDRDTSGILMLAKKRTSLALLHKQIREKKIKKEYIALVHGSWPSHLKKISAPLLKIKSKNKKMKMLINQTGKFSETHFQVKKKYSLTTLLLINPKTGRTHQIRAHALYAGHPILFDKRYGDNQLDIKIKETKQNNRLLLHASRINFNHPKNGNKIYINAPLDSIFTNYLNSLT